jgi:pyrroline-5-carboxylate reductase
MLLGVSRIAIVGGGNIGEALLAGLLRSGQQLKDLVVAERVPSRVRYLSDRYSVLVTGVAEAIENADLVVIAVKPTDVEAVTNEIADATAKEDPRTVEHVFVTVAAGVTTAYFESKLPAGAPVIRVMPNAPMLVGAGISAVAKGRFATPGQLDEVASVFGSVGEVLVVPESQLDAVTAVSGSGPAYFFLMVEALVDAGVAAGLSRPVAAKLAAQTMLGSGVMLVERMEEPERVGELDTAATALRTIVTSPAGTTSAGLAALERGGFRAAVAAAVEAAKNRAGQLGITSE